jgi:hypothetical protein
MLSDEIPTVKRTVSTLMDAFSAAGGMMSVIFVIITVIIQNLQKSIYFTQLIKDFYTYQEEPKAKPV